MRLYEYILVAKDQFSGTFNKLRGAAGMAEDKVEGVTNEIKKASGEAGRFGGILGSLKGMIVTVFAVGAITAFGAEVIDVTARMEGLKNAINFASGGAQEGAANLQFLKDTAQKLGIPLEASMQGFKTLSAAMMGSKLQGEQTRQIFESVSIGASAMGLTADQAEGAFLALGQMMGKGKVSAEELRGQLGERIPGAFQIAARAMGVTTAELDKMMADGKIIAEDFLPKFAQEMRNTFEGALPASTKSLRANLNRMNNQWSLMQLTVGEQLAPAINGIVTIFTNLMIWVQNNIETIKTLAIWMGIIAGVILVYQGALLGIMLVSKAYALITTISTAVTALFTGGFAALNAVMMLNPIGAIIALIVVLIGVFIWAYNKFEWFRGGVWGIWESFKVAFDAITDIVKNVFGGIADMIDAIVEGDMDKLQSGISKFAKGMAATNPVGFYAQYGEDLGTAFTEGYADGVNAEPIGLPDFLTGGNAPAAELVPGEGGTIPPASTETQDSMDNISGGGSRAVNVTVNVAKFQDKTEIHAASVDEGVEEIEDKLREMLARVLNGGIYSATQ